MRPTGRGVGIDAVPSTAWRGRFAASVVGCRPESSTSSRVRPARATRLKPCTNQGPRASGSGSWRRALAVPMEMQRRGAGCGENRRAHEVRCDYGDEQGLASERQGRGRHARTALALPGFRAGTHPDPHASGLPPRPARNDRGEGATARRSKERTLSPECEVATGDDQPDTGSTKPRRRR